MKEKHKVQKTKQSENSVYGVGEWEIWDSNILQKLNLACLLQDLRS